MLVFGGCAVPVVPRLVHQVFHDPAQLPAELLASIDALRTRNTAWNFSLYSEQACFDFIRRNYPARVLSAYNAISPLYFAARTDFFRYLVLYEKGGIYLDAKSSASRPLDEVVGEAPYLLAHWDNRPGERHQGWGLHFQDIPRGEFQQWNIASLPKHPFLKWVIEQVLHNIENYSIQAYGVGARGVLSTTGPIPYTLAIKRCINSTTPPHRIVDCHLDVGLVYSVYENGGLASPTIPVWRGDRITANSPSPSSFA